MFSRMRRAVPAVAAAAIAALGVSSLALADEHHRSDAGQAKVVRCDRGTVSAWDEEWLKTSIEGDRFEIQGGTLAQQKAQTDQVRTLGAVLVRDHTKSLAQATRVAERLGVDVPDEPSPSQQWELGAVAAFSGRDFNRWYADLEVQDHTQDIQEAQDEVDMGCNHTVRHLAKDELPTLQKHLELAQAALAAVTK
jgi:putative membrane protein